MFLIVIDYLSYEVSSLYGLSLKNMIDEKLVQRLYLGLTLWSHKFIKFI